MRTETRWWMTEEYKAKKKLYDQKYRAARREIANAQSKAWRLRNPEARQSNLYKHKYGITLEQVREMVKAQAGACKICKHVFRSSREWAVDHCHKTSRVRGVLCSCCNFMLGFAKDRPEVLAEGAAYLHLGGAN